MAEQPPDPADSSAQAEARAAALFGAGAIHAPAVTQVCATVRADDGRLHVLAIGPHAPKSELDFFALNLARARADAILTSAQIVRSEPALSHRLAGSEASALQALRRRLGKREPPLCAILTRSADLPLDHPVWDDGTPKAVLTSPAARAGLAARLGARAEVHALDDLGPRAALGWLRQRAQNISVEAGPRVSSELYRAPALVDELLLSRVEGTLAPAAIGGALPSDGQLFQGLLCVHQSEHMAPSGRWIFQRWLRQPAG